HRRGHRLLRLLCEDETEGEGVAADVLLPVRVGYVARQCVETSLRNTVGHPGAFCRDTGSRRSVDDGPSAPLEHFRDGVLASEERTPQVDRHGEVPYRGVDVHYVEVVSHGLHPGPGRVVVQG